jgi:hypothetical protein
MTFVIPLKGPMNFVTADNERRCDANHAVMRFLAQDSLLFESFAVRARRAVKFNADPQASAPHLLQV